VVTAVGAFNFLFQLKQIYRIMRQAKYSVIIVMPIQKSSLLVGAHLHHPEFGERGTVYNEGNCVFEDSASIIFTSFNLLRGDI
jgi:hypothetical protein